MAPVTIEAGFGDDLGNITQRTDSSTAPDGQLAIVDTPYGSAWAISETGGRRLPYVEKRVSAVFPLDQQDDDSNLRGDHKHQPSVMRIYHHGTVTFVIKAKHV